MPGSAFNIKKETLIQVFSCEFSCEHHLVAASALKLFKNIAVLSANLEILINTKILVLKNSSIFLLWLIKLEAVVRRCSVKNLFLEILQNSQENTCARVSFLTKLQASDLSCDFYKISKNTFFIEHLWTTLLL